jgi:hypothetical protein
MGPDGRRRGRAAERVAHADAVPLPRDRLPDGPHRRGAARAHLYRPQVLLVVVAALRRRGGGVRARACAARQRAQGRRRHHGRGHRAVLPRRNHRRRRVGAYQLPPSAPPRARPGPIPPCEGFLVLCIPVVVGRESSIAPAGDKKML